MRVFQHKNITNHSTVDMLKITFILAFHLIILASQASENQVRIVTCEEPPANYLENGKVTGLSTEVVRAIMKKLDTEVEIELMPWARAYEVIAKTTPNVVVFTCGKSPERVEHGFHWVGPMITRKHILWKKKGSEIRIGSEKDIIEQNLQLSSVRSDWRGKYFLDLGVKVDESVQQHIALSKLINGRVDLWVSSDIEAPPVTQKLGIDIGQLEVAYIFKEAPSFIMLSKGTSPDIIKKWQQAFKQLKQSDFFEKACKKWGKILKRKILFSEKQGFHFK